ncbi:MAG: hypothetical protein IPK37_16925 [Austwickia sp.]|jgi:hypothetical protein|nr:MAG: hypothetical protein IPK37_16925 [Austwickia sp.]
MTIDKTPLTQFGWLRASLYTALTLAIWLILDLLLLPWKDAEMPGFLLAVACGVAMEYLRRDRARKADGQ